MKRPDNRRLTDQDAEAVRVSHDRAIRELQDLLLELQTAVTGSAGIVGLPLAESDVTNLVSDLASKVPNARTLSGAGLVKVGGGASADLSANRTITVETSATSKIIGRTSSGGGNAEELTGTQATAILDVVGAAKGLVPASPSDAGKFLRGDATPSWAVVCQVDQYEFANTGATWNRPSGAKMIEVIVIGGGGGGGGGKLGAAGTERCGGGGGGGACVTRGLYNATDCPSSAVILVGGGGGGGAGGSSPSNGSPGTQSDFGGRLIAYPGGAGQAGSGATGGGGGGGGGAGAGGIGNGTGNNGGAPAATALNNLSYQGGTGGSSPPSNGEWGGGGGGRSNSTVGAGATGGGAALYGGAGGGGGGSLHTDNGAGGGTSGAKGGSSGTTDRTTAGGGGGVAGVDTDGPPGTAWGPYCGGGGGGGGAASATKGGNGGNGFIGCGGGGGGASVTGKGSGNGGNGGDGRVIVITYF